MAEITNGYQGGAHLAVRIEVLRSGEGPGPMVRGGISTNGSCSWLNRCRGFLLSAVQQDVLSVSILTLA